MNKKNRNIVVAATVVSLVVILLGAGLYAFAPIPLSNYGTITVHNLLYSVSSPSELNVIV